MSTPAPAGAVAAFAPPKRGRLAATRLEPLASTHTERLAAAMRAEPLASSRFTQLAPWHSGRFISAVVLETDLVLRRLTAVGSVVILPLARVAAAITQHTAWQACGYRTQADFTRERLNRDSRWLRQLVSLHQTLERLPGLAEAISGADGGRALNQSEALVIGRVATPANVGSWIARARQLSLEELRGAVLSASPGVRSLESRDISQEAELEDESRVRLRFSVPPDVRWIFEAALELYRCVEGWDAGITGFVPALVAEASSAGCVPPDDFRPRWQGDARRALRQRAAEALRGEAQLGGAGKASCAVAAIGHGIVLSLHTPAMRRALQRLECFDSLRSRLRRLERKLALFSKPGSKTRTRDLRRLVGVLQVLVRMQDEIQIDVGELLLELHDNRMWRALGFRSLEAYAEERLGMGGSTAHQRVGLARRLPRLGLVRQAYESGQIGTEAAGHLVRRMQDLPPDEALQRQWLRHVMPLTVKRLRDEDRFEHRRQLLAQVALACAMTPGYSSSTPEIPGAPVDESATGEGACQSSRRFPLGETDGQVSKETSGSGDAPCQTSRRFPLDEGAEGASKPSRTGLRSRNPILPPPVPLDDATWRRSLVRYPGDICNQAFALACGLMERVVRKGPLLQVPLILSLPEDDGFALQGCIEAARRRLSEPDDALSPARDSQLPPSGRIARFFVQRKERVPEWVGLLALLEEWIWEHDGKAPRRSVHPIFARDSGRCMAPGCTSRARLEVHHLRYRSHGGSDTPDNLILLCALHHRQGEHGDLARCRGKAPLDVVWRLGHSALAVWYRNERRLTRRP